MTALPSSPSAPSFDVGVVVLDRYEITGVLGTGGMSRVYAADDRQLGRPVALRIPTQPPTPEVVARFEREARITLRLYGPHFATLHDLALTVDGIPMMVMERLVGEDLSAYLRRRGPLPLRQAIDLVLQACEAIAEAHALGIVHLDLKPSNLFVVNTPEGTLLLKVLDFGVSRMVGDERHPDAVGGTPLYAAPEQMGASGSADPQVDVWALGVIVYELLAGTPPFAGANRAEVRSAVSAGSYRKLSSDRDDIPPALDRAIAGALAVEPWMRAMSVASFAETLWPFGGSDSMAASDRIQRIAERPNARSADTSGKTAPLFREPRATRSEGGPPRRLRWTWRRAAGAALGFALGAASTAVADHARRAEVSSEASYSSVSPEAFCNLGDASACLELALAEDRIADSERAAMNAFFYYRRACFLGSMHACVVFERIRMFGTCPWFLGGFTRDGDGTLIALDACDHGEGEACADESLAFEYGHGVTMDRAAAFEFAERACERGAIDGCAWMARARLDGDGVAVDVERGRAELRASCDLGGFSACEELAALDAAGLPTRSERPPWPAAPVCPPGEQWDDIAKNIGQD